ncbi:TetR/AcrR family transcriptional regulator [Silvimonas iriomotensis]|uniref:HTH tetR-type domain-containing protein n=1 Tax=Silvimonas iriomotensis TaxID=449662 RepID=A0ABQ2P8I0_9NEIS|nr:TetR/AcrR family transcriptional regulator [Silvimonas iriomotensis]GGP20411.1 hypothetical protein GCM10010970_15090 [Silvimonas iriomotensis]
MQNQSRSSATRQLLLDATRKLLIEQGYARLGEARVCEHAGVTRGALRYHFPEGLLDLLPVLLAEIVEIEVAKIDSTGVTSPRERIYLGLFAFAGGHTQTDSLALLELWMAARGDSRLGERLNPILHRMDERIFRLEPGQELEPDLLACRLLLHGASLHIFSGDFDRAKLAAAMQWVMSKWPLPEGLRERFARRPGDLA